MARAIRTSPTCCSPVLDLRSSKWVGTGSSLQGCPWLVGLACLLWLYPSQPLSLVKWGSPGHYEAESGSPILWRRKPRLSEGICLCQGHKASKWQGQLIPRHKPLIGPLTMILRSRLLPASFLAGTSRKWSSSLSFIL